MDRSEVDKIGQSKRSDTWSIPRPQFDHIPHLQFLASSCSWELLVYFDIIFIELYCDIKTVIYSRHLGEFHQFIRLDNKVVIFWDSHSSWTLWYHHLALQINPMIPGHYLQELNPQTRNKVNRHYRDSWRPMRMWNRKGTIQWQN